MSIVDSQYAAFFNEEVHLPSWMSALVPGDWDRPDVGGVESNLRARLPSLTDCRIAPDKSPGPQRWALSAAVDWDGSPTEYTLRLDRAERLEEFHFRPGLFTARQQAAAKDCTWMVTVETFFAEQPLRDFHRQVRVVQAAVPDAPAVLDAAACTLHPGQWAVETADTEAMPSPENLWCIHDVQPEQPGQGHWLHTHGLLRCKRIELEFLDVPEPATVPLGQLLNAVATCTLDMPLPPPDSVFEIGRNMPLIWQPWQHAVARMKPTQGGIDDRRDAHGQPSGVLLRQSGFWPFRRRRTPVEYARRMSDNPLVLLSDGETDRLRSLAQERLSRFRTLFELHGQSDNWAFLVKLACPGDDPANGFQTEHIWFQVHDLTAGSLDATCINRPYAVASLHEGDRGEHDLSLLTDWSILSPAGQFGPDKVLLLEMLLEDHADELT